MDDNNETISLKWILHFGSAIRSLTPGSVITIITFMAGSAGTPKNKLNKIREEDMERDNKEARTHHSVDSAALLL